MLRDLAKYTLQLLTKAKSYGSIFTGEYREINAYASIHNGLLLTLELSDYYYKRVEKEEKQSLREQDVERMMTISRWSYIHSFSIIEHISKELIKKTKCKEFEKIKTCLINGTRVDFSGIITQSKQVGLVDKNEMKIWDNLREIRNAIVHNNGYFDKNGKFEFGSFTIEYEKSKGLESDDLNLAHKLTEVLMDNYYNWAKKIIKMK